MWLAARRVRLGAAQVIELDRGQTIRRQRLGRIRQGASETQSCSSSRTATRMIDLRTREGLVPAAI